MSHSLRGEFKEVRMSVDQPKTDKLAQIKLSDFLDRINNEFLNLMVHLEALGNWEIEVFEDKMRSKKAMLSLRESRNHIGTLVEEFYTEGVL